MTQSDPQADQILSCVDCRTQFVFTRSEQEFFVQKALTNTPKRCPDCRVLSRANRKGSGTTTTVQCTECGVTCRVPFVPKGHSPVLCLSCKHGSKVSGQHALKDGASAGTSAATNTETESTTATENANRAD